MQQQNGGSNQQNGGQSVGQTATSTPPMQHLADSAQASAQAAMQVMLHQQQQHNTHQAEAILRSQAEAALRLAVSQAAAVAADSQTNSANSVNRGQSHTR